MELFETGKGNKKEITPQTSISQDQTITRINGLLPPNSKLTEEQKAQLFLQDGRLDEEKVKQLFIDNGKTEREAERLVRVISHMPGERHGGRHHREYHTYVNAQPAETHHRGLERKHRAGRVEAKTRAWAREQIQRLEEKEQEARARGDLESAARFELSQKAIVDATSTISRIRKTQGDVAAEDAQRAFIQLLEEAAEVDSASTSMFVRSEADKRPFVDPENRRSQYQDQLTAKIGTFFMELFSGYKKKGATDKEIGELGSALEESTRQTQDYGSVLLKTPDPDKAREFALLTLNNPLEERKRTELMYGMGFSVGEMRDKDLYLKKTLGLAAYEAGLKQLANMFEAGSSDLMEEPASEEMGEGAFLAGADLEQMKLDYQQAEDDIRALLEELEEEAGKVDEDPEKSDNEPVEKLEDEFEEKLKPFGITADATIGEARDALEEQLEHVQEQKETIGTQLELMEQNQEILEHRGIEWRDDEGIKQDFVQKLNENALTPIYNAPDVLEIPKPGEISELIFSQKDEDKERLKKIMEEYPDIAVAVLQSYTEALGAKVQETNPRQTSGGEE